MDSVVRNRRQGAEAEGSTQGGVGRRLSSADGPVLVVMTDVHMGNTVLSLPIIERLAAYFDKPVDLLVDERYADLAQLVGGLRRVLRYPTQATKRRGVVRNLGPAWMMVLTTMRYKVVIDFGGGTRQSVHTLSTLAPKRVGLADHNPWAYNYLVTPPPGLHAYEHYACLLEMIGQTQPPPWTGRSLVRSPQADQQLEHWLGETFADPSENGRPPTMSNQRIAVIHPSAGDAYRCWPPQRFAAVADRLVEDHGMNVVLIGSPSETQLMGQVRNQMKHANRATSARLPLVQLLSLFDRACLLVSNESGPTHLASLTDLPIVTLFGPTREQVWRPYRVNRLKILRGATCDPRCGKRRCVLDLPCLRNIQTEEVMRAVGEVLGQDRHAESD